MGINASRKYIYALIDPRTEQVRYVGQTKDPEQRYSGHLTNPTNDKMAQWVEELNLKGLQPDMHLIDIVPRGEALRREREITESMWAAGLKTGWNLLNRGAGDVGRREDRFDIMRYAQLPYWICECGERLSLEPIPIGTREFVKMENPVDADKTVYICPGCGQHDRFRQCMYKLTWDEWWNPALE